MTSTLDEHINATQTSGHSKHGRQGIVHQGQLPQHGTPYSMLRGFSVTPSPTNGLEPAENAKVVALLWRPMNDVMHNERNLIQMCSATDASHEHVAEYYVPTGPMVKPS